MSDVWNVEIVELALILREDGQADQSADLVEAAEQKVDSLDIDAHLALWDAYTLMSGRGDWKQQSQRALLHLEKVAELGNPAAQEVLARHYRFALNGCGKDIEKFGYWVTQSADQGHVPAIFELSEYLYNQGKKVPERYIKLLSEIKGHSIEVDDLIIKLSRNN